MRPVVIIGRWKHDDPQRRKVFRWVKGWYESHGFPVTVGTCESDVWVKAEAFNLPADDDVVIMADADFIAPPESLKRAVELARRDGWATPGSKVRRFTQAATADVLASDFAMPPWDAELDQEPHDILPGGGIVCVRRDLWEATGFDPRFRGWGGEDWALGCALWTLANSAAHVVAGPVWHLWHPPAEGGRVSSPETDALAWRYRKAKHRPDDMRALLAEWRGDAT